MEYKSPLSKTGGGCRLPAAGLTVDFEALRGPVPFGTFEAWPGGGVGEGTIFGGNTGGRWTPRPFCQMVGRWSKFRAPRRTGWRISGEEEVETDPAPTGVLANWGSNIDPDTLGFCKEVKPLLDVNNVKIIFLLFLQSLQNKCMHTFIRIIIVNKSQ